MTFHCSDTAFVPTAPKRLPCSPTALSAVLRERGVAEAASVALRSTAAVIPFKTTPYIINELIDWRRVPDDPIFKMNFPAPGQLPRTDLAVIEQLVLSNADDTTIDAACRHLRYRLLASQTHGDDRGIPLIDGQPAVGVFHNFPHTVFLFPSVMNQCFAHCNYCLRWAKQFHICPDFTYRDPRYPVPYLESSDQVTDIIFSGGDAFNASAEQLRRFVAPLLQIPHLHTLRFSTRALSWQPTRLTEEADADELLRLLDNIVSHQKHVAVMAHLTHPTELSTPVVEKAISRILSTGAVIRGQGPILRHINDSPDILSQLWRREVQLGIVPYYLFLESQTGLIPVYKLSVKRALDAFWKADAKVGGLAKTIRGPVINSSSMKLLIAGSVICNGKEHLLLRCLQSENPSETGHTAIIPANLEFSTHHELMEHFRKAMR